MGEQIAHEAAGVDPGDLVLLGARRLAAQQPGELRRRQGLRDGPQAHRVFRVSYVGDVVFAGGVTEQESGHIGTLGAGTLRALASRASARIIDSPRRNYRKSIVEGMRVYVRVDL